MRVFWSIILLSQVLLITCREGTFYLIFKINQDYLAQNVCEKRFEPKSCCEGSCTLRKVILESREEPGPTDSAPIPTLDRDPIHFLEPEFPAITATILPLGKRELGTVQWQAYLYTPTLLRPPRA